MNEIEKLIEQMQDAVEKANKGIANIKTFAMTDSGGLDHAKMDEQFNQQKTEIVQRLDAKLEPLKAKALELIGQEREKLRVERHKVAAPDFTPEQWQEAEARRVFIAEDLDNLGDLGEAYDTVLLWQQSGDVIGAFLGERWLRRETSKALEQEPTNRTAHQVILALRRAEREDTREIEEKEKKLNALAYQVGRYATSEEAEAFNTNLVNVGAKLEFVAEQAPGLHPGFLG
jgi:hypothetical protein